MITVNTYQSFKITMKTPPAAKNMRFALADPKCLLKKEGDTHTIQVNSTDFEMKIVYKFTELCDIV